jgi:PKD repeat protein
LLVDIFATPRGGDATTPITFTTRVTTNDGSPTGALTYAWDFETDGIVDSREASPTHFFRPADHWTVTVRVTSANGRTGGNSIDVVIGAAPGAPNLPPPPLSVALTFSPATVPAGTATTATATVTGLATSETVASYQWDFNTATPAMDATTLTGTRAHTYATHGVYTARVTITTSTGRTVSGDAQIIVTN